MIFKKREKLWNLNSKEMIYMAYIIKYLNQLHSPMILKCIRVFYIEEIMS